MVLQGPALYTSFHTSAQHVHQESHEVKVLPPRLRVRFLMTFENDATPYTSGVHVSMRKCMAVNIMICVLLQVARSPLDHTCIPGELPLRDNCDTILAI